jgi:hypothetical protein
MAKYEVITLQLAKVTHEIEAESMEQALTDVGNPNSIIKDTEITADFVDSQGLSLEELAEIGVDTEYVSRKINIDRNDDHANGIFSIRLL